MSPITLIHETRLLTSVGFSKLVEVTMYVRTAVKGIWSLCAQRPLTAVSRSEAGCRPGLILCPVAKGCRNEVDLHVANDG